MALDRTGCFHDKPTVIETFTGKWVEATNIKLDDIDFRDIAHSLAHTCRYGGHCRRFYSVAEHSIHCYDMARRARFSGITCLATLLHDAGEAFWHDLARPLKVAPGMEAYSRYLDTAQNVVELKAGSLACTQYDAVFKHAKMVQQIIKEIDNAVLKTEVQRLMSTKGEGWNWLDVQEAADIPRWKWEWYRKPRRAELGFLKRLRRHGIR